jgi:hypothetical protein
MSLRPRDEPEHRSEGQGYQSEGRRYSDLRKENFSKNVIEARMREAEYKDSIGMELTQYDEFLLQNKQFFKKILRKEKEKG